MENISPLCYSQPFKLAEKLASHFSPLIKADTSAGILSLLLLRGT